MTTTNSWRFPIWIHRKEQWDLDPKNPSIIPLVCAHWRTANGAYRIFVLWSGGLTMGRGRWRVSFRFPRFRVIPRVG